MHADIACIFNVADLIKTKTSANHILHRHTMTAQQFTVLLLTVTTTVATMQQYWRSQQWHIQVPNLEWGEFAYLPGLQMWLKLLKTTGLHQITGFATKAVSSVAAPGTCPGKIPSWLVCTRSFGQPGMTLTPKGVMKSAVFSSALFVAGQQGSLTTVTCLSACD